jgi:hypothetical protein
MASTSGLVRAAGNPARSTESFEAVSILRQRKPMALTECWDCGGQLTPTPGTGCGFLCTICSSRWRSRWIPCPWWERLIIRLLPRRYRWQSYRVERGQQPFSITRS